MIKKYNDQTHKAITNAEYIEYVQHKREARRLRAALESFFPYWQKEQRLKINIKAFHFAKLMGVSASTLEKYERGVRIPRDMPDHLDRVELAHLKYLEEQIKEKRGELDEL